jgi:hypothetical protein
MCFHHWGCAPAPAYTPTVAPHFQLHLVETITITVQIELDITT